MKKSLTCTIASLLLSVGTLGYAQQSPAQQESQRPQDEAAQLTLKGWLTKGSQSQQYVVADQRSGEKIAFAAPSKLDTYVNQTVEVSGAADAVAPVDSGEKSSTLTSKELQNYVQVGSNAAEYIKIMPGFGIQNGAQNKANYNGQTIGINANGDSGSQSPLNNAFSYNGLPSNTLDIVADGAHVSDPGCNCDTPVNPNSDFVQEFRVLTSWASAMAIV